MGSSVSWTAQDERKLFLDYQASGSDQLRQVIVDRYRALIFPVARKQVRQCSSLTLEDLYLEGVCGLLQAAGKFKPRLGYRFSTYATYWIFHAINRAIEQDDPLIRKSSATYNAFAGINRAVDRFEMENGREPTGEEVQRLTGCTPTVWEHWLQYRQPLQSLDFFICDNGTEVRAEETIASPQPDMDTLVSNQVVREIINRGLAQLQPNERLVLEHHFGLNSHRQESLTLIGNRLRATRQRARQLEVRAIQKLRVLLSESAESLLAP